MKIMIIEDERPAATRLIRLLEGYFDQAEYIQRLDSVKKNSTMVCRKSCS